MISDFIGQNEGSLVRGNTEQSVKSEAVALGT